MAQHQSIPEETEAKCLKIKQAPQEGKDPF